MLTGHGDEDTRQRAILAGANGLLTKPFSPIALEQTIRSLLGASNLPPLSPSEIRSVPERISSVVAQRQAAPAERCPDAPVYVRRAVVRPGQRGNGLAVRRRTSA